MSKLPDRMNPLGRVTNPSLKCLELKIKDLFIVGLDALKEISILCAEASLGNKFGIWENGWAHNR